jgi:transposase InsO family protein
MGMEGEIAMPWKEMNIMQTRAEFIHLARQKGSNIRQLCRRYGITPRTAYKWLKRYEMEGISGLEDRSKRPKRTIQKVSATTEAKVLNIREETGWGGRKIARVLIEQGCEQVPHPNTITDILRRNGQLSSMENEKHQPVRRFEYASSNELWQMDFKGHFSTLTGRCHPLTVLDDHSRFCLGLRACENESGQTVKAQLVDIFRQYGLPKAFLCDNGAPWGTGYPVLELSALTTWLIRLGIHPLHGRPAHPQTQGKDERFHRTLKTELLQGRSFTDLADCQYHFDRWRDRYNLIRPHEALHLDAPVQHFQISQRTFPEVLPPVEYDEGEIIRKVQDRGVISYQGHTFRIGKGLIGQFVALRPSSEGLFDVFFCSFKIRQICLTLP